MRHGHVRLQPVAAWVGSRLLRGWITARQGLVELAAATVAAASGTGKTMTRAAFDALPPAEKMTFTKGGGVLTD